MLNLSCIFFSFGTLTSKSFDLNLYAQNEGAIFFSYFCHLPRSLDEIDFCACLFSFKQGAPIALPKQIVQRLFEIFNALPH